MKRSRISPNIPSLSGITFEEPRSRVSCRNCIGACCLKNTVLPLAPDEALQLEAAGTEMSRMPKEEWRGNKPPKGRDFFKLISDCGNLVERPDGQRICADYANRPDVCRELKEGSYGCMQIRAVRLPDPVMPHRIEPIAS